MASSSIQIECCICMEVFSTTRRPRGLPCLHHFCTECLQSCITQGSTTCSVCRRDYTAAKAEDIPINNTLENIIQMYSQMASSSVRTNDSSDEEEDFSKGKCSKHRKCLCYFKCISHGIYICRECTVVEHSPTKCNIIEIKEEMMKEKEETLKDAQQSIAHLDSITSTLETIVTEKKFVITSKQAQINVLLSQIDKEREMQDQVEKKVDKNISTSRQLKEHVTSLQRASTKNKISKECLELQNKIKSLKKLLTELDEKYDNEDLSKILLKDPKQAVKVMERRNMDVFAVDGASGNRSSKLEHVNVGTLQFSSMEKDAKPTSNATIIPVASLMSVLGSQPIVYLDLAAHGRHLGRLRIMLTCGPRRKEQMIRLCTGQGGTTRKGTYFQYAWNVGRAGEQIRGGQYLEANGSTSKALIVQGVEQDKRKVLVAGAVTGYNDDTVFNICTTSDASDTDMKPELGRVVAGLDMLSRAIRQYAASHATGASQIKIVQSGVEITS